MEILKETDVVDENGEEMVEMEMEFNPEELLLIRQALIKQGYSEKEVDENFEAMLNDFVVEGLEEEIKRDEEDES